MHRFLGGKGNRRVLKLWENVWKSIRNEKRDQLIFNRFLRGGWKRKLVYRATNFTGICKYSYLPETFFLEAL